MRRFVALLLLAVLSLQHAWAALGPYCQHEESAQAQQHFGHHFHNHQQQAGSGGDFSGAHNDCAFCHLGCAGTPAALLIPCQPEPASLAALEPVLWPSSISSEPERPKWPASA